MKIKWTIKDLEKCLLGTTILFIMTYMAVWKEGDLYTDYFAHANWTIQLYTGEITLTKFLGSKSSYPLWHIVTYLLYALGGLDKNMSAAISTAFFNCFAYWSVNYVWHILEQNNKQKCCTWFWSFCLMIMGPLNLPRYTNYYYLGQGSGNTWHNPTNIAVKGFAVLAFGTIIYLLYEGSRKEYMYLVILLVCSALAKPSFLQGIIPGLGLFFLLRLALDKTRGFRDKAGVYLKVIVSFIPAVIIIGVQFYLSFFGGGAKGEGIGFSFGYVLGKYSPNLFHSFLVAFAFPCIVLVIDFKKMIKNISVQLTYCYEFCAWLEGAVIYEKGERVMDGNWLWGSYISMFIVWMVSVINFCEYINRNEALLSKKRIKIGLGVSIFFVHVICGFLYWYDIAMGRIAF